ncbi:MAG TPA: alpha-galactosidase [Treponema sp.]|nr:alpha-galactosidase [Treponema sp.]
MRDIEQTRSVRSAGRKNCGLFVDFSFNYNGPVENGFSSPDKENRVAAEMSIESLLDVCLPDSSKKKMFSGDFFFYGSGWQSWGFGGELSPGEHLKKYIPLVPQWKQYITFPGKWPSRVLGKNSKSSSLLRGQFVCYLRWKNNYLVLCSTGAFENGETLPPVQFYVDRKSRNIAVSVYSDGKIWQRGETVARLCVFTAENYFALKDGINLVYGSCEDSRFDYLRFLNCSDENLKFAGWESWYNHYADINEKLIQEDLDFLGKTENIINREYTGKEKPVVFQVDDGWEKGLGDWDAWKERFPGGMTNLASSISEKGYVPGLWIAPFIVDMRSDFAQSHKDWILRDKKGKPVAAGMNFLWGGSFGANQPGAPWSYFCLDLSRDEVVSYLDDLMEKVVNDWFFRYIKLDFMFAGMIYGKFANGGAAYKWYDRAVKTVTKRTLNKKGERVAYLGCGIPFESSFSNLPLSRIGPDTKEDWDVGYLSRLHFTARTGAKPNLQSTLGHSFWDQSIFINDPDVIFLRYENISLDDNEKLLIALVNRLFASQIMHSDDPVDFSPAEADFTSTVTDLYSVLDGEEFGLVNYSSETYMIFSKSGRYCGLINLSEKPFTVSKEEMIRQVNEVSGSAYVNEKVELEPLIDNIVTADDLYTSTKHTITIFRILEGE